MEQSVNIWKYVNAIRRKLWLVIIILIIGSAAAVGVAYVLPPVFQASAKILVVSQQIPESLAESTVTQSAAERLQIIEQRLMTNANLLDIANRLNLYDATATLSAKDIADDMRASIFIESVPLGTNRNTQGVAAFVIAYRANGSVLAARVTDELVTRVLEQNIESRKDRATDTHDFFKRESDELLARLQKLESDIVQYQRENEDALPDSLEFRRKELSELRDRTFERQSIRLELEERRRQFSEELAAGDRARPTTGPLSPEEQQLQILQQQYIQLSATLSESHPRVRAVLARIKALENAISDTNESEPGGTSKKSNKKRLEKEIALIDDQLALLKAEEREAKVRRETLLSSIERTPNVQMELSSFYRKREDLEAQYQQAVQKKAQAATGMRLEVNRQAERFEIIEPVEVPKKPIAPKRKLIAIGGFGASLFAGILLILTLEMLNATLRTADDLERQLQVKPIAVVPYIMTPAESRRRIVSKILKALFIFVVIPGGIYLVDQHIYALDGFVKTVIDKSGLQPVIDFIEENFQRVWS